MRLATFVPQGTWESRIGVVDRRFQGEAILDLNAACAHYFETKGRYRSVELAAAMMPSDMLSFLDGGPESLQLATELVEYYVSALKKGKAGVVPQDRLRRPVLYSLSAVQLRAPIPRPRGMGIGYFNTRGIIEEASRTEHKTKPDEGIKMTVDYPKQAAVSWANASSVIGPDDEIIFPNISKQLFNSIELGLVVGRRAYRVAKGQGDDYVVGYTVTSDITAFDLVQKENFVYTVTRCKSMPTFWPTGPWIVTKDEVGDAMKLKYNVRVNGQNVMKGSSSEYVYSPADYIVDVSEYMLLEPGMIIGMGAFVETTNTFLKVGDVVENEIEKIGVLRNRVAAESLSGNISRDYKVFGA